MIKRTITPDLRDLHGKTGVQPFVLGEDLAGLLALGQRVGHLPEQLDCVADFVPVVAFVGDVDSAKTGHVLKI